MSDLDEWATRTQAEVVARGHDYERWLEGVRSSGVSPTLTDYQKWSRFDDNLFWRLSCGDHLNLLDEAIGALEAWEATQ